MKLPNIQINWFDFAVVILFLIGLIRGKKRGMSLELLDVLKWLGIIAVGGEVYRPLGRYVANFTNFSVGLGYVCAYLFCAVVIWIIFALIKRAAGEKLVSGDAFGRLEYILGALAGGVRFLCVLFVMLALLNAKYISAQEQKAFADMQQKNFGSISFPTLASLQNASLHESAIGPHIKTHLSHQLIDAVPPGPTPDSIVRQRERAVEDAGSSPFKR